MSARNISKPPDGWPERWPIRKGGGKLGNRVPKYETLLEYNNSGLTKSTIPIWTITMEGGKTRKVRGSPSRRTTPRQRSPREETPPLSEADEAELRSEFEFGNKRKRKMYTGPKGGKYYLIKGKKVYVKSSKPKQTQKKRQSRFGNDDKFKRDILDIYYRRLSEYKQELQASINRGDNSFVNVESVNSQVRYDKNNIVNKLNLKLIKICKVNRDNDSAVSCTAAENRMIRIIIDKIKSQEKELYAAFTLDVRAAMKKIEKQDIEAATISVDDDFLYIPNRTYNKTPNLDQKFIDLRIFPGEVEMKPLKFGKNKFGG